MPKKILVIDDDLTSNSLVGFLLKTNGYEVTLAADGEEGLKEAEGKKPDLIVLDIMMPKMDGYTFLKELKRANYLKIPPVIMLTSKDQMEDVFRMEGVSGYFVKPLETEKFLKMIGNLLADDRHD